MSNELPEVPMGRPKSGETRPQRTHIGMRLEADLLERVDAAAKHYETNRTQMLRFFMSRGISTSLEGPTDKLLSRGRPRKGEDRPRLVNTGAAINEDVVAQIDDIAALHGVGRSDVVRRFILEGVEAHENGFLELSASEKNR